MNRIPHPARPSRRRFLGQTSLGLAGMMFGPAPGKMAVGADPSRKLRVAAVVTEFTYRKPRPRDPRELPGALPVQRQEDGLGNGGREPVRRPVPEARHGARRGQGVRHHDLSDDRGSLAGRGRQAGGGRGAVDRRARPVSDQRQGAGGVSAQAILRRDRGRVPPERSDGPGVQRQAPVVSGRLGQRDGRRRPARWASRSWRRARSRWRCAGRRWSCPEVRGSRRRSRCTAATWRATTSTGWRCCSRWSNRGRGARPGSRTSSSSMGTGCGRRPTRAGGRPSWPTPPGRPIPTPRGPARCERSSSRVDSAEKLHGILVTYKDGLRGTVLECREGRHALAFRLQARRRSRRPGRRASTSAPGTTATSSRRSRTRSRRSSGTTGRRTRSSGRS